MMTTMLLFACLALHGPPTLATLDAAAQARDVAALSAFVDNLPKNAPDPLRVIKTNGAYECGKFGWHAYEMISPTNGDRYVALSTPLTSEDIGDLLFKRTATGLHYIPEDESLGAKVLGHNLDVSFEIAAKRANVVDQLSIESEGSGDFVFRMSNEFRVSKITDSGQTIPFSQGGGIVVLKKPSGKQTLEITYTGIVDRPLYSGSITDREATLTNCYWYPMVARQPAPYEVTAHYPNNWVAIGQGEKLSQEPGMTHYKMDLPCIFYSLSAGPYKTGKFDQGGRTFYSWSPRLSPEALAAQAETYASIVNFYERFGAFPFKSYGGLDSPQYGGGALEAYSYATYGGGFPYVDAHEPSHTWWGGILENSYLHSFWNESFAVYSDGLYHREWSKNPANEPAFTPQGEADASYDQLACDASGADSGGNGSALGYGKGSHVLFLLEKLIGLDQMTKSMKRFVTDQPSRKTAEWSDFEAAAEKENPTKHLETFFADWIQRPGHLELDAKATYADGAVNIDYKPKGQPYRVPLEVMVQFESGKREFHTFDVREGQTFKIPVSEKPSIVSIDPYRFLIRQVHEDESPVQFRSSAEKFKVYVDPAHPDWSRYGANSGTLPPDVGGALLVGSPETWPDMAVLCQKAGFTVDGSKLTYKGTTIDLNHGGAVALVDLGDGRTCGISLGKTRISPDLGSARTAVFDDLGRFLNGETEPKTKGFLTTTFQ